jgi:hypothetical protein
MRGATPGLDRQRAGKAALAAKDMKAKAHAGTSPRTVRCMRGEAKRLAACRLRVIPISHHAQQHERLPGEQSGGT